MSVPDTENTLTEALREARPYVFNVSADWTNHRWRREAARDVLDRVDAALAAVRAVPDTTRLAALEGAVLRAQSRVGVYEHQLDVNLDALRTDLAQAVAALAVLVSGEGTP